MAYAKQKCCGEIRHRIDRLKLVSVLTINRRNDSV